MNIDKKIKIHKWIARTMCYTGIGVLLAVISKPCWEFLFIAWFIIGIDFVSSL